MEKGDGPTLSGQPPTPPKPVTNGVAQVAALEFKQIFYQ